MENIFKFKWVLHHICIAVFASIVSPNLLAANHALLIGIQTYPNTLQFEKNRGFQQLSGPRNDIQLLEKVLRTPPFEFPKTNITVLLDKQATHSAIEKAFTELKKRVKPDDFVYIHFSGHGSEAINDNPDIDKETAIKDGKTWDQTWVPYGASAGLFSSTGKGKDDWDIRDDEINVWLANLGTEHIVFVSDSCHAGSVSRGPKIGVRGIPMDARVWPRSASLSNVPLVGIRIGASGDQEFSYEVEQNGESYGRFTWFWSKALNELRTGETWGDIFNRTKVLMREETMDGRRVLQNPQIEPQVLGERDIKVLGGNFTSHDRSIVVAATDNKGLEIKLSAGLLSGVTKGSIYRVFAIEDSDDAGVSAEAEIIGVTPFSSTARVLKGHMNPGDLLKESQHAYDFKPVRVILEGADLRGKDKALAAKIAETLKSQSAQKKGASEFKIVSNRQDANWIIYLLHPEKKSGKYVFPPEATLPASNPSNPAEAWVLNTQEEPLDDTLRVNLSDVNKGVKELAKKLDIVLDMRDLMMLKNDAPKFIVKAHRLTADDTCQENDNNCFIVIEDRAKKKYRAVDTNELHELDAKPIAAGTKMGFTVENTTDMDYYLYLLNISARDGAFALFPPPDRTSEAAKVPPGKKKLPDVIDFVNTGREIIKAILSKEQLDPQAFEFAGTEERRGASKGPTSLLERLLNRTARRAHVQRAPEPSEWGTIQAEILVKESN